MSKTELGNQLRELIANVERIVDDGKKTIAAAKKLAKSIERKPQDEG